MVWIPPPSPPLAHRQAWIDHWAFVKAAARAGLFRRVRVTDQDRTWAQQAHERRTAKGLTT